LRMLLEDYLRCSGGLAKQATGRKLVVCALCTHRPGGASGPYLQERAASRFKFKRATHNNEGINKSKTNNISNISIVLSKLVIILFRIL
jgi:hypothetical protein